MKYVFFILITLSASPLYHLSPHQYFIVWNVGQGQWTTFVDAESCLHFDLGGEFFPWKKIRKLCQQKQNKIYLSHWDWDHIGGLSRWPWSWSRNKTCLALRPLGKSSPKKMRLLSSFPFCKNTEQAVRLWTPPSAKDSNSRSHVIRFQNILLPGDSPTSQEKIWILSPLVQDVTVMVLGHHGSATSTSAALLARLPGLRLAVSSARWRRYGHPHPDVQARLRLARVALVRTEDWGNLLFQK